MEAKKNRKSHARGHRAAWGWIAIRKGVQALALAGFLGLFIAAQRGSWPGALLSLPLRLDPLAVAANLLSSRILLTGSLLALATVALTLVFGRAWCGWLCPLGTLLDFFSIRRRKPPKTPPESWRSGKYLLLYAILAAALLGNLTLLVLDPLTLLYRALAAGLWPALDRIVTLGERALYPLPFLAGPVATLDEWIRPTLFPSTPAAHQWAVLIAGLLLVVLALDLAAPRFWCRYLCPLGGLLGLLSKFSLVRRRVSADCKGCTLCTQACPTGTIRPEQAYASDPAECTVCLECLTACPRQSTAFKPAFPAPTWLSYDPGRRQALATLGVAVAGAALLQVDTANRGDHPHLIRPPGVLEDLLLSRCVRCGACLRACPTNGLQAALLEAGLEGLWTPLLVPRLGYCDYACSACGQACPVQAIPPLTLVEKRQVLMGQAYIDQDRCIAWADGRDCIVCEEMCPIPEKAIQLEQAEVLRSNGNLAAIQQPHVLRERCLGCGICEYKCPVPGEAAIRVYRPNVEAPL